MYIDEKRFTKIFELASGAEAANKYCFSTIGIMNGFARGLNAAMEILNAENDEQAMAIAAKHRKAMANLTGTTQENWTVGEMTPDENWVLNDN